MSDFQNVYYVYQIKGFGCFISNKLDRLTISRGQILILLVAKIQDKKNLIFLPLNYTSLQKVQYLLNESSALYEILVLCC